MTAVAISFQDLPTTSPEGRVAIRGFLYQTEEGHLILAGEPNLRSCCVASTKNLSKQIIVNDGTGSILIPEQGYVSMLEGNLIVEGPPAHTAYRYYLNEPVKIAESSSHLELFLLLAFGIIIFSVLCVLYKLNIFNRHPQK
jgi:hypothetical protein